jgi:hypothetical protein
METELWPMAVWSFFDEGKPYSVGLDINEFGQTGFNGSVARDLWIHSFEIREALRLYVDGCDVKVPLQYRVLSLYKLLEDRFRSGKQWDHAALTAFLAPYEPEFRERGFQGDLVKALHALRDSCAHIRTGYRKQLVGVTHLSHKQAVRAERALQILIPACVRIINELAVGKFQLAAPAPSPASTKTPDMAFGETTPQ